MKWLLIFVVIFITGYLYAFQDISITIYAQTEQQAKNTLFAKAVEEYDQLVRKEKSQLYGQYGQLYFEAKQNISYSLFQDLLSNHDCYQIEKEGQSYKATCSISADSLSAFSARNAKKHYQRGLHFFTEYKRIDINQKNFGYALNLIMQATDEMMSTFEYSSKEQLQVMGVFTAFEHFLNEFIFVSPASVIMPAEKKSQRQDFYLYFQHKTNKIALANIPILLRYAGQTKRLTTDKNGKCSTDVPEGIQIEYEIDISSLFRTDDLTNREFITLFLKKHEKSSSGSFTIETIGKRTLYFESKDFSKKEAENTIQNYLKQGYLLKNTKDNNAYTLRLQAVLEEDRSLYIGGYYLKGYVLQELVSPAGHVINSKRTKSVEVISDQDRVYAFEKLLKLLKVELK